MDSALVFSQLQDFFSSRHAQVSGKALKNGTEIAIQVQDFPVFCLTKNEGTLQFLEAKPEKPDMSFQLGIEVPTQLLKIKDQELSIVGISIFRLMLSQDPKQRITVKIHVDFFTLLKNGYFKILALGGPELMQFLVNQGLGNVSKLKTIISRLKDK